jgi:hypothetical protein
MARLSLWVRGDSRGRQRSVVLLALKRSARQWALALRLSGQVREQDWVPGHGSAHPHRPDPVHATAQSARPV